ncbi:MAG TPA: amidohydrolase/deacetylase family metallohydrolase [Thermomicrobiales bacterium]|jgi:dihydroorotase|nr:amidohydrolase/deacetylase family metallohydrolase [Thermomicrobiales bacterium]
MTDNADSPDPVSADLILAGGHVIDPANGFDGIADVAIAGDRIVAVGPDLDRTGVAKVLDVAGHIVTPGIIDMHVHAFTGHKRSTLSLDPVVATFSTGVTTVVDAGTAGYRDFQDFVETVITKSQVRVLSFVNIVGSGMIGPWEHEPAEFRVDLAAATVRDFPEVAVGIKTAHYRDHNSGAGLFDDHYTPWAAVDSAVAAGEKAGVPVMVDFWPWEGYRSYPELILEKLRPGDIHTHVFAQQFPIIDEDGKVFEHMHQARERGVIFDLGHGAGSFWFRNAVPAIEQGFIPDSISTDLHTRNVNGAVLSMLTTMNKILNLGVPLSQVIAMSTTAPARQISRPELGTLSVGAEADVAVFRLDEGTFNYVDCGKWVYPGTQRLTCQYTLRAGEVVYNPEGWGRPTWHHDDQPRWQQLTTPIAAAR